MSYLCSNLFSYLASIQNFITLKARPFYFMRVSLLHLMEKWQTKPFTVCATCGSNEKSSICELANKLCGFGISTLFNNLSSWLWHICWFWISWKSHMNKVESDEKKNHFAEYESQDKGKHTKSNCEWKMNSLELLMEIWAKWKRIIVKLNIYESKVLRYCLAEPIFFLKFDEKAYQLKYMNESTHRDGFYFLGNLLFVIKTREKKKLFYHVICHSRL